METSTNRPFAVVTGASSGIGRELAREFAEHGYDVLVAAEDPGIEGAAAELRAAGTSIRAVQCDLATDEGVEQLWEATGRPVDAIALNAGVGVGGPFVEHSLAEELNVVKLNVVGTVHLAKLALTAMVRRGEGKVLFTSSIASTMPNPNQASYAATKSFVQSFAEALREEVKDSGVTVTSLMPGPTETGFFSRGRLEDTPMGTGPKDDAAQVARQGFEALMAGREKVVGGGVKSKLAAAMNTVTPDTIKAKAAGLLSKPGAGKDS